MGFGRLRLAYGLKLGNPARKSVLTALAYRACDDCGIAWPGVAWIMATAEISRRRVQECLAELTMVGLLAVRKYSTGGRGVATEYIVLPGLGELSTAPCEGCALRMKNGAERARLLENTAQPVRRLEAKPRTARVVTAHATYHHQSEKHNQSGSASPPSSETALTGRLPSDPPLSVPRASKDALRALGYLQDGEDTPEAP